MNKARRRRLAGLHERLTAIKEEVDAITDEERSAYENLPDSIREGDKGQAMDEAADKLSTLADDLENAASALEEITQ